MSNGADIRDVDALSGLKAAFGRFGEDVLEILPALQKQFEEIQGRLGERQLYWGTQVDHARDELHEARHEMHKCHRRAEWADDDDYVDCSFEEERVSDAEKQLAECEENWETVKQWRHRIESQIADFQNDMHRLSHLASERTGSAQAFLADKIEVLDRYVGGMSTASAGLQRPAGYDNMQYRKEVELTSAEKQALFEYTGPKYWEINEALRSGHSDETIEQLIRSISSALTRFPRYVGTVYRRAPSGRYLAKYVPGKPVEEKGFTSASKLRNPPFGGNVYFTIKSKTGRDISSSAVKETEEEVLFDRGTRFNVTSRRDVGHNTEIDLEEL